MVVKSLGHCGSFNLRKQHFETKPKLNVNLNRPCGYKKIFLTLIENNVLTQSAPILLFKQEIEMNFRYFQWSVHDNSIQSLCYVQAFGLLWVFIYNWVDLWDLLLNFIASMTFLWFFWSRKHNFCSKWELRVLMEHKNLKGHDFLALK